MADKLAKVIKQLFVEKYLNIICPAGLRISWSLESIQSAVSESHKTVFQQNTSSEKDCVYFET